jgi:hypothetical protein
MVADPLVDAINLQVATEIMTAHARVVRNRAPEYIPRPGEEVADRYRKHPGRSIAGELTEGLSPKTRDVLQAFGDVVEREAFARQGRSIAMNDFDGATRILDHSAGDPERNGLLDAVRSTLDAESAVGYNQSLYVEIAGRRDRMQRRVAELAGDGGNARLSRLAAGDAMMTLALLLSVSPDMTHEEAFSVFRHDWTPRQEAIATAAAPATLDYLDALKEAHHAEQVAARERSWGD